MDTSIEELPVEITEDAVFEDAFAQKKVEIVTVQEEGKLSQTSIFKYVHVPQEDSEKLIIE